jgi:uncharacterized membrane protein
MQDQFYANLAISFLVLAVMLGLYLWAWAHETLKALVYKDSPWTTVCFALFAAKFFCFFVFSKSSSRRLLWPSL